MSRPPIAFRDFTQGLRKSPGVVRFFEPMPIAPHRTHKRGAVLYGQHGALFDALSGIVLEWEEEFLLALANNLTSFANKYSPGI